MTSKPDSDISISPEHGVDHPLPRVAIKVPRPDSQVEVRLSPPENNYEVKVAQGGDYIELFIRPGNGFVEVRISPPGEASDAPFKAPDNLYKANVQYVDSPSENLSGAVDSGRQGADSDEVVTGVSRAEFKAMVEEEEAAEAKKLLANMPDMANSGGYAEANRLAKALSVDSEAEKPATPLELEAAPAAQKHSVNEEALSSGPSGKTASVIERFGSARDEMPSENKPEKGNGHTTPPARWTEPEDDGNELKVKTHTPERLDASATIMVEMYDDAEPSASPALTRTPLPEEDQMDLSAMEMELEADEELAIDPIDVNNLDIDLEKSRTAAKVLKHSVIKAKPLFKVSSGKTIVPTKD